MKKYVVTKRYDMDNAKEISKKYRVVRDDGEIWAGKVVSGEEVYIYGGENVRGKPSDKQCFPICKEYWNRYTWVSVVWGIQGIIEDNPEKDIPEKSGEDERIVIAREDLGHLGEVVTKTISYLDDIEIRIGIIKDIVGSDA